LPIFHYLKQKGVILATNVIIDYKNFPNPLEDPMIDIFDYVSWNPYWDGVWNIDNAARRFEKYLS
jgi:hypothetical protein